MEQSDFLRQNAKARVLFLLCFFASSTGEAFNTVFIRQLLLESGEERALLLSLPITAMSAMMVLGVLLSGRLSGKCRRFTSYTRVGAVSLLVGLLVRGLAFRYWLLLIGFAVSGFGVGILFIAIRYYAFRFQNLKRRTQALTYVAGGSFVGQCLGTIFGGILAQQVGYRYIYLFSAVFLLVPITMMNRVHIENTTESVGIFEFWNVLKNRKALLFLLCAVLPIYACTMFVSYAVPLYVDDYGYSSALASVLILGNYLLSAYAGPFCTGRILSAMSARKSTMLYMLLTAAMVLLYVLFPSMGMLTFVVIACGLLDSFGLTVTIHAFTELRGDDSYSESSALIVFVLFSRIGQMIGPAVISVSGSMAALSAFLILGMSISLLLNGGKLRNANGE